MLSFYGRLHGRLTVRSRDLRLRSYKLYVNVWRIAWRDWRDTACVMHIRLYGVSRPRRAESLHCTLLSLDSTCTRVYCSLILRREAAVVRSLKYTAYSGLALLRSPLVYLPWNSGMFMQTQSRVYYNCCKSRPQGLCLHRDT